MKKTTKRWTIFEIMSLFGGKSYIGEDRTGAPNILVIFMCLPCLMYVETSVVIFLIEILIIKQRTIMFKVRSCKRSIPVGKLNKEPPACNARNSWRNVSKKKKPIIWRTICGIVHKDICSIMAASTSESILSPTESPCNC